jgi:hypothetical protein
MSSRLNIQNANNKKLYHFQNVACSTSFFLSAQKHKQRRESTRQNRSQIKTHTHITKYLNKTKIMSFLNNDSGDYSYTPKYIQGDNPLYKLPFFNQNISQWKNDMDEESEEHIKNKLMTINYMHLLYQSLMKDHEIHLPPQQFQDFTIKILYLVEQFRLQTNQKRRVVLDDLKTYQEWFKFDHYICSIVIQDKEENVLIPIKDVMDAFTQYLTISKEKGKNEYQERIKNWICVRKFSNYTSIFHLIEGNDSNYSIHKIESCEEISVMDLAWCIHNSCAHHYFGGIGNGNNNENPMNIQYNFSLLEEASKLLGMFDPCFHLHKIDYILPYIEGLQEVNQYNTFLFCDETFVALMTIIYRFIHGNALDSIRGCQSVEPTIISHDYFGLFKKYEYISLYQLWTCSEHKSRINLSNHYRSGELIRSTFWMMKDLCIILDTFLPIFEKQVSNPKIIGKILPTRHFQDTFSRTISMNPMYSHNRLKTAIMFKHMFHCHENCMMFTGVGRQLVQKMICIQMSVFQPGVDDQYQELVSSHRIFLHFIYEMINKCLITNVGEVNGLDKNQKMNAYVDVPEICQHAEKMHDLDEFRDIHDFTCRYRNKIKVASVQHQSLSFGGNNQICMEFLANCHDLLRYELYHCNITVKASREGKEIYRFIEFKQLEKLALLLNETFNNINFQSRLLCHWGSETEKYEPDQVAIYDLNELAEYHLLEISHIYEKEELVLVFNTANNYFNQHLFNLRPNFNQIRQTTRYPNITQLLVPWSLIKNEFKTFQSETHYYTGPFSYILPHIFRYFFQNHQKQPQEGLLNFFCIHLITFRSVSTIFQSYDLTRFNQTIWSLEESTSSSSSILSDDKKIQTYESFPCSFESRKLWISQLTNEPLKDDSRVNRNNNHHSYKTDNSTFAKLLKPCLNMNGCYPTILPARAPIQYPISKLQFGDIGIDQANNSHKIQSDICLGISQPVTFCEIEKFEEGMEMTYMARHLKGMKESLDVYVNFDESLKNYARNIFKPNQEHIHKKPNSISNQIKRMLVAKMKNCIKRIEPNRSLIFEEDLAIMCSSTKFDTNRNRILAMTPVHMHQPVGYININPFLTANEAAICVKGLVNESSSLPMVYSMLKMTSGVCFQNNIISMTNIRFMQDWLLIIFMRIMHLKQPDVKWIPDCFSELKTFDDSDEITDPLTSMLFFQKFVGKIKGFTSGHFIGMTGCGDSRIATWYHNQFLPFLYKNFNFSHPYKLIAMESAISPLPNFPTNHHFFYQDPESFTSRFFQVPFPDTDCWRFGEGWKIAAYESARVIDILFQFIVQELGLREVLNIPDNHDIHSSSSYNAQTSRFIPCDFFIDMFLKQTQKPENMNIQQVMKRWPEPIQNNKQNVKCRFYRELVNFGYYLQSITSFSRFSLPMSPAFADCPFDYSSMLDIVRYKTPQNEDEIKKSLWVYRSQRRPDNEPFSYYLYKNNPETHLMLARNNLSLVPSILDPNHNPGMKCDVQEEKAIENMAYHHSKTRMWKVLLPFTVPYYNDEISQPRYLWGLGGCHLDLNKAIETIFLKQSHRIYLDHNATFHSYAQDFGSRLRTLMIESLPFYLAYYSPVLCSSPSKMYKSILANFKIKNDFITISNVEEKWNMLGDFIPSYEPIWKLSDPSKQKLLADTIQKKWLPLIEKDQLKFIPNLFEIILNQNTSFALTTLSQSLLTNISLERRRRNAMSLQQFTQKYIPLWRYPEARLLHSNCVNLKSFPLRYIQEQHYSLIAMDYNSIFTRDADFDKIEQEENIEEMLPEDGEGKEEEEELDHKNDETIQVILLQDNITMSDENTQIRSEPNNTSMDENIQLDSDQDTIMKDESKNDDQEIKIDDSKKSKINNKYYKSNELKEEMDDYCGLKNIPIKNMRQLIHIFWKYNEKEILYDELEIRERKGLKEILNLFSKIMNIENQKDTDHFKKYIKYIVCEIYDKCTKVLQNSVDFQKCSFTPLLFLYKEYLIQIAGKGKNKILTILRKIGMFDFMDERKIDENGIISDLPDLLYSQLFFVFFLKKII